MNIFSFLIIRATCFILRVLHVAHGHIKILDYFSADVKAAYVHSQVFREYGILWVVYSRFGRKRGERINNVCFRLGTVMSMDLFHLFSRRHALG